MYLIDTNVWLERLLDQEHAKEVGRFLDTIPSEHFFMTDFTFHSIGIVMTRLNRKDAFLQFVQDTFIDGAVSLIHLKPEDTQFLIRLIEEFNLDFDDAYQYTAAEKYNLIMVSFDKDFDRTTRGRKAPGEIT